MPKPDPLRPLTEKELDELDNFLLDRIPEGVAEEYDENLDEGILDISELDGFLTAVVSSPNLIQPSRWIPVVWGDCDPVWDTLEEAQKWITMLIRHMNSINKELNANSLEPIFGGREVDGENFTIVDEWCEGYMRGVFLDDGWRLMDDEAAEHLAIIMAFTQHTDWIGDKDLSDAAREKVPQAIASAALWLDRYWRGRRSEFLPPGMAAGGFPGHRTAGANDPCPCGSGLKYKKCCRGN
ncbi:MAG: UPF0149 family protein [Aridibacter famidurans]|nr:UPF0149 family protein [Aridibacter famidurans]